MRIGIVSAYNEVVSQLLVCGCGRPRSSRLRSCGSGLPDSKKVLSDDRIGDQPSRKPSAASSLGSSSWTSVSLTMPSCGSIVKLTRECPCLRACASNSLRNVYARWRGGSLASTTPLSVMVSLSPSKNATGAPTVHCDSIRRPYQYVLVNSPWVSAAHSRSGVVAIYVTYTNSGFPHDVTPSRLLRDCVSSRSAPPIDGVHTC